MSRFLVPAILVGLVMGVLSFPASANTITFETAPAGPGPFGGMVLTGAVTEAGFTYSTLSGQLIVTQTGNPGHDMEGLVPGGGVLQIVSATSGNFTFDGLDFRPWDSLSLGSQTLSVEGFFGATLVGTDTYTQTSANNFLNWTTEAASVLAGQTLTSLDIVLNAGDTGPSNTEFFEGIDNVVLTPAPVPEPSSLLLLGTGLLGLAGAMRRKWLA